MLLAFLGNASFISFMCYKTFVFTAGNFSFQRVKPFVSTDENFSFITRNKW